MRSNPIDIPFINERRDATNQVDLMQNNDPITNGVQTNEISQLDSSNFGDSEGQKSSDLNRIESDRLLKSKIDVSSPKYQINPKDQNNPKDQTNSKDQTNPSQDDQLVSGQLADVNCPSELIVRNQMTSKDVNSYNDLIHNRSTSFDDVNSSVNISTDLVNTELLRTDFIYPSASIRQNATTNFTVSPIIELNTKDESNDCPINDSQSKSSYDESIENENLPINDNTLEVTDSTDQSRTSSTINLHYQPEITEIKESNYTLPDQTIDSEFSFSADSLDQLSDQNENTYLGERNMTRNEQVPYQLERANEYSNDLTNYPVDLHQENNRTADQIKIDSSTQLNKNDQVLTIESDRSSTTSTLEPYSPNESTVSTNALENATDLQDYFTDFELDQEEFKCLEDVKALNQTLDDDDDDETTIYADDLTILATENNSSTRLIGDQLTANTINNLIEHNQLERNLIEHKAIEHNKLEHNPIERNLIEPKAIEHNQLEHNQLEHNTIERNPDTNRTDDTRIDMTDVNLNDFDLDDCFEYSNEFEPNYFNNRITLLENIIEEEELEFEEMVQRDVDTDSNLSSNLSYNLDCNLNFQPTDCVLGADREKDQTESTGAQAKTIEQSDDWMIQSSDDSDEPGI